MSRRFSRWMLPFLAGCGDSTPTTIKAAELPPVVRDSEVFDLAAAVLSADGDVLQDVPLHYLSAAPAVLSVSDDGHAVCHGTGTVKVTITSGELAHALEVRCALVAKLEAPAELVAFVGDEDGPVTVRALAGDGQEIADAPVTWSSDAPTVASVDAGMLHLGVGGLAQLMAKSGTAEASVRVVVNDVGSIRLASTYVVGEGRAAELPAVLLDHTGAAIKARPVITVDSPGVVDVREGVLVGATAGVATVRVRAGRTSATTRVVVYEDFTPGAIDLGENARVRVHFDRAGHYGVSFHVSASDGSRYGVTAEWEGGVCPGSAETQDGSLVCSLAGPGVLVFHNPVLFFGLSGIRETGTYQVRRWPIPIAELGEAVPLRSMEVGD